LQGRSLVASDHSVLVRVTTGLVLQRSAERYTDEGTPTVRTTVSIYDPTKLDFNVSADLTVTLDLFGLKVEVAGDRREQMMAMFESLLTDFEAKAVSLDIREGNYG
jgi:hypothetical protein